jgi:xylulokinase
VTIQNYRRVPNPEPPFVLTFDLGTTLHKLAVFDAGGAMLRISRVAPPSGTAINYAELVDFLWCTCRDFVRGLSVSDARQIRHVSFASQANSFALLDADDEPLTPFILWPDRRAATVDLSALGANGELHRHAGLPRISPLMTISKLAWIARQEPLLLKRAKRVQFLGDWLTHSFTGEHLTDAGTASLSGMLDLDLGALDWWDAALVAGGVSRSLLPKVVLSGTALPVTASTGKTLGLSPHCEFSIGTLDQHAGAIGVGATATGDVCETTGTVLAAVRATDRRSLVPGIFEGPSHVPGRYWQMSFSSTSANLLEWYRSTLPDRPDFSRLSDEAETAASAAPIVAFDEGQPISHCFRDVTPSHTRGQIVRGIMERVAWQLKSQIDQLCGDDRPRLIRSAGGGAKSKFWLELKSQIVGIPCVGTKCDEPTSLGAAKLTGLVSR